MPLASLVLVDSSFYIDQMRRGCDPLKRLAYTAAQGDLVTCGIVQCEVGRGLRDRAVLEKFQRFWSVMIYAPCDQLLWEEVLATLWNLDRKGMTLPLIDVIIACSARRIGATVLTLDAHFHDIPGVRVSATV